MNEESRLHFSNWQHTQVPLEVVSDFRSSSMTIGAYQVTLQDLRSNRIIGEFTSLHFRNSGQFFATHVIKVHTFGRPAISAVSTGTTFQIFDIAALALPPSSLRSRESCFSPNAMAVGTYQLTFC